MYNRNAISSLGLVGCIILAVVICTFAVMTGLPPTESDFGICLPSPNLWPLLPEAATIINLTLLVVCVLALSQLNKRFSLIRSTDHVLTAIFVVLGASNIFVSATLTAAMPMLVVTLISLRVLFDSYKADNATQPMFVMATFLSLGTMIEYSFVPLALTLLLGALTMRCMGPKEFCAFILGLAAPYWVGIGLGLLPLDSFHMPQLDISAISAETRTRSFVCIIGNGVLLVISFILAGNNITRLYAGNSRIRCENNVINLLGLMSAICLAADYHNMTAYFGIFYLWVATQIANFFALTRIRRPWILFTIILIVILGFALPMIFI